MFDGGMMLGLGPMLGRAWTVDVPLAGAVAFAVAVLVSIAAAAVATQLERRMGGRGRRALDRLGLRETAVAPGF